MKYIPLCFLCLAVMVLFIVYEHKESYVKAVLLKGLASFAFVIFGFLGSKLCADEAFAKRVVAGLVLGLIADVLLNLRFVFEKKGKIVFLVGILVFLSGHVLYLLALIPKCEPLLICVIAGVVLTAITMVIIFKKITAAKAFKIFGVFYIGAIMIMTCVAIGIAVTAPSTRALVFAAGAVSFLVSDIVLILNTFGSETKFSLRITNLSLYYIGQILIAACLQL